MLGIPSRWERISSACIRTNNLHCWALQSLGVVDLSGMEYLHGGFNGVQKEFKAMKVNCDCNCPLSMESKGQQLKPTATWRHWRPCVGPRRNEPDPVCRRSRSWVETLETNSPPIPAVVAASSILGVEKPWELPQWSPILVHHCAVGYGVHGGQLNWYPSVYQMPGNFWLVSYGFLAPSSIFGQLPLVAKLGPPLIDPEVQGRFHVLESHKVAPVGKPMVHWDRRYS